MVARYESFALVEAAGDDEVRLRDAGADRRDDMREVAMAAGEFDPAAERASLAARGRPTADEVLALVQFVGPPKDAWVERLRPRARASCSTSRRTPTSYTPTAPRSSGWRGWSGPTRRCAP